MTLKQEKFRELYSKTPLYIFALALILAVAFFLLFLDIFKTYNTEISIIFIPQNEKTAEQADQIAENLTIIPTKLSFYERLLRDNKEIEDQFVGLSDDRRKFLWNKAVQVERERESTIIKIEANDPLQSQELARQTAFTLFNVMSQYYNIKTDIDFRIIDGPITDAEIKNWLVLLIFSLIIGIVLAFLINIVSLYLVSLYEKRKSRKAAVKKISLSFPKQDLPQKENVKENEPIIPKALPKVAKKSQAPANLPVIQNLPEKTEAITKKIYSIGNSETGKMKEAIEKKEEISENKEPTEEELKERLNQLLRGDL